MTAIQNIQSYTKYLKNIQSSVLIINVLFKFRIFRLIMLVKI